MAKYQVVVRVIDECVLEIEAPNEAEARDLGYDEVAQEVAGTNKYVETSAREIPSERGV
jgi:hypothetical protein